MARKKLSDETVKYSLLLPAELEQDLKIICARRKIQLASVMRQYLEEGVTRELGRSREELKSDEKERTIRISLEGELYEVFQKLKTELDWNPELIIRELLKKHFDDILEEAKVFKAKIKKFMDDDKSNDNREGRNNHDGNDSRQPVRSK